LKELLGGIHEVWVPFVHLRLRGYNHHMLTAESGYFFNNLLNQQNQLLTKLVNKDKNLVLVYKERQSGFTSLLANYASCMSMTKSVAYIVPNQLRADGLKHCYDMSNVIVLSQTQTYLLRARSVHIVIIDEVSHFDNYHSSIWHDLRYPRHINASQIVMSCDSEPYLNGRESDTVFHQSWKMSSRDEKFVLSRTKHEPQISKMKTQDIMKQLIEVRN
jgi:predicted AAA+ superfamily ATPase